MLSCVIDFNCWQNHKSSEVVCKILCVVATSINFDSMSGISSEHNLSTNIFMDWRVVIDSKTLVLRLKMNRNLFQPWWIDEFWQYRRASTEMTTTSKSPSHVLQQAHLRLQWEYALEHYNTNIVRKVTSVNFSMWSLKELFHHKFPENVIAGKIFTLRNPTTQKPHLLQR